MASHRSLEMVEMTIEMTETTETTTGSLVGSLMRLWFARTAAVSGRACSTASHSVEGCSGIEAQCDVPRELRVGSSREQQSIV
jgi:hypothetical protein